MDACVGGSGWRKRGGERGNEKGKMERELKGVGVGGRGGRREGERKVGRGEVEREVEGRKEREVEGMVTKTEGVYEKGDRSGGGG